jgi:hypothetical protein
MQRTPTGRMQDAATSLTTRRIDRPHSGVLIKPSILGSSLTTLALAGCATAAPKRASEPPRRPEPAVAQACIRIPAPPQAPDSIVIALSERVEPSDAPAPSNESERLLFAQMYETLLRVDCTGRILPGLARAWSMDSSSGSQRWTFTVRDDARFWSGAPVTAAAVIASWRESAAGDGTNDIASRDRGSLAALLVQHATALDERTLVVTLPEGDGSASLFAAPELAVARRDAGPEKRAADRGVTGVGNAAGTEQSARRAGTEPAMRPTSSWPEGSGAYRVERGLYTPGEPAREAPSTIVLRPTDSVDELPSANQRAAHDVPASNADTSHTTNVDGTPHTTNAVGSPGAAMPNDIGHSGATPRLVFRIVPGRDPRDVLDGGVDLLLARTPSVVQYAATEPERVAAPLEWDRVYVLLFPSRSGLATEGSSISGQDSNGASGFDSASAQARALGDALAGAVHADARGAVPPFWWSAVRGSAGPDSTESAAADPAARAAAPRATVRGESAQDGDDTSLTRRASTAGRTSAADRMAGENHIVYDRDDRVARDLAERLVALAAPPRNAALASAAPELVELRQPLRAAGLDSAAFARALAEGRERAYVIALPRSVATPRWAARHLRSTIPWLGGNSAWSAAIVPLVDTRATALARRGVIGLMTEGNGTLRLMTRPSPTAERAP